MTTKRNYRSMSAKIDINPGGKARLLIAGTTSGNNCTVSQFEASDEDMERLVVEVGKWVRYQRHKIRRDADGRIRKLELRAQGSDPSLIHSDFTLTNPVVW